MARLIVKRDIQAILLSAPSSSTVREMMTLPGRGALVGATPYPPAQGRAHW